MAATFAHDYESPREAALAYQAAGLAVVPVEPGGKRPLVRWQAYQTTPPTRQEIGRWFQQWPDANVGILTGRVSGLVVLDIDPRHGGEASLEEWRSAGRLLPATAQARTGGGGRHVYFHHPGVAVHNRVALAPGVDFRGDGGLVVAPPSRHPSGGYYQWLAPGEGVARQPSPMPPWLVEIVSGGERGHGHPAAYWRHLVHDGVREGARNDTIASLTGHLLWRDVDLAVITELLLCWNGTRCRPPLGEDEVVRTVESIARTHKHGHRAR